MIFSFSSQGSPDYYWKDAEERVSMTNLKGSFALLSMINVQFRSTFKNNTKQTMLEITKKECKFKGSHTSYKISNISLHKPSNSTLIGNFPQQKRQTA